MIAGEERGGNGDPCRLLEAADGGSLVGKNFEDGEELCDLQKVVNFFREVQKFQFATLAAHCGVGADEFADAGAVDVIHVCEIQNDIGVRFVNELANRFAEHGAAIAEGDAAAGVNDGDCAGISGS